MCRRPWPKAAFRRAAERGYPGSQQRHSIGQEPHQHHGHGRIHGTRASCEFAGYSGPHRGQADGTRYNLFMIVIAATGLVAVVVPLVIR